MKEQCNRCSDKIKPLTNAETPEEVREALEEFHQMKQEAFMDGSCDDVEACIPLKELLDKC